MTEVADEQNMPASRVFYISKKLAKKLVKDEALRKIIVASAGYVNLDFVQVSRKRFLSLLSDVLEIPPFVVIDEKSRTEKNGIPMVDPKDFDENKIILAPAGKLFNAYPSLPDYAKDSNPATVKGSTENGIIGSLTRYESEPFAMITNMEAWLFPVFKNPKWLVGLDTSKGTTDGLDK